MLRLVADWERANHLIDEGEHGDLAWTQAALYVGMLDWAEVAEREDGDDSYYQWDKEDRAEEQLADREDDVPCGRHCGVAGVADDV